MPDLGRTLVGAGVALLLLGLLVLLLGRTSFPLGHLPGDLIWRGRNWHVAVPLGTSLLVSLLLSLVLWAVSRFR